MYRAGVLVVHEDRSGEQWWEEIETLSWSSACNYVNSFVDMWTVPGFVVANVWIRSVVIGRRYHSEQGEV
jgi:hypothetical protein